MRQIHIHKTGFLYRISGTGHIFHMPCPLHDSDETSRSCNDLCPWFSIEGSTNVAKCKDHTIGLIIKEEELKDERINEIS